MPKKLHLVGVPNSICSWTETNKVTDNRITNYVSFTKVGKTLKTNSLNNRIIVLNASLLIERQKEDTLELNA